MIRIKRISNEDSIHYFKLDITPDIHSELINFFHKLSFPEDELTKIDTPFSELEGEYICIKKKDIKVHFFVTKNDINLVVDSDTSQKKLSELMKKHFIFP